MTRCCFLNASKFLTCYTSCHETGHVASYHRPEHYLGHVWLAGWRQCSKTSQLDTHGGQVREATQSVGGYHNRAVLAGGTVSTILEHTPWTILYMKTSWQNEIYPFLNILNLSGEKSKTTVSINDKFSFITNVKILVVELIKCRNNKKDKEDKASLRFCPFSHFFFKKDLICSILSQNLHLKNKKRRGGGGLLCEGAVLGNSFNFYFIQCAIDHDPSSLI